MTTAPLPLGTRVRATVPFINGTGIRYGNILHVFGNGLVEVLLDTEPNSVTLTNDSITPTHARPYDPATEHAKIIDGNTMGVGKHVDMQHYGTLPKHSVSKRYDMRLDGVRALIATEDDQDERARNLASFR